MTENYIERFLSGQIIYSDVAKYFIDTSTKNNILTLVCGSALCKPIHLKYLWKWGIDFNHVNVQGQTSIHVAITNYLKTDVFKELVSYYPKNSLIYNIRDRYGNTPLHLCAGINSARTAEMLKILCKQQPGACLNTRNLDGQTVLHIAVKNLNYQTIKVLQRFTKQIDANIQDQYGKTAIFYATTLDILEYLDKSNFGKYINWHITDAENKTVFDRVMEMTHNLRNYNEYQHLFRFLLNKNALIDFRKYNWSILPSRLKACVLWKKVQYFVFNKPYAGNKNIDVQTVFYGGGGQPAEILKQSKNDINLNLDLFINVSQDFWFVAVEKSSYFLLDIREAINLKQNPYTNTPFDDHTLQQISNRFIFISNHRLYMKDIWEFDSSQSSSTSHSTPNISQPVRFFANHLSYISVDYLQNLSYWAVKDIHDLLKIDPTFNQHSNVEQFLKTVYDIVQIRPSFLSSVEYAFGRRVSYEDNCRKIAECINIEEARIYQSFEPYDYFTKKDLEYIIRKHYANFQFNSTSVTQSRLLQKYITIQFITDNLDNPLFMADIASLLG